MNAMDAHKKALEDKISSCYARFPFLSKFSSEFMGTLFLAWIFAFATTLSIGFASLIATGYFGLLLASGQLSQGFYNPVIVLTEVLLRHIPVVDAIIYLIAQFGGAFMGTLLAFAFRDKESFVMTAAAHKEDFDLGKAFALEFLSIGFMLMFFSMSRSTGSRYVNDPRTSYFMFSLMQFTILNVNASLTGGMFNPAIDVFNNVLGFASLDDYDLLSDDAKTRINDSLVIYLFAPLIGVVVAFILSALIYDPSMRASAMIEEEKKAESNESPKEDVNASANDIKEETISDRT